MRNTTSVLGIKVCLLFPILFLLSCSPHDKKSGTNQQASEENVHKTDTVTIQMMKFNPEVLNAGKGDTVVWINKGLVPHTVKSYQENKMYSDTIAPGQSWKWVITDSASYFCTIHPATMKAKVMLQQ